MKIYLLKIYARIHELVHTLFGVNLRGLGLLYSLIKDDKIITVKGKKMLLNHRIADNYGRLINGRFNEPETHFFLDKVFAEPRQEGFHFVDIGCNVGEFVLDYASHANVNAVTAFDAQAEQIETVKKTVELNSFVNVELINQPVSDKEELIYFNVAPNSTASGINQMGKQGQELLATTIDASFDHDNDDTFVFLIDTEGAELSIMKGGLDLIRKSAPLIIFEYNHVTRRHFGLNNVRDLLGQDYDLFRLRKDGLLDQSFERTWNVVAMPRHGKFAYLKSLVKY